MRTRVSDCTGGHRQQQTASHGSNPRQQLATAAGVAASAERPPRGTCASNGNWRVRQVTTVA
eukprot:9545383-Alexandrium_andersonii.AAC.1